MAIANVLPYRGARGEGRPTRVWDLPIELMSDEGDASAGEGYVGSEMGSMGRCSPSIAD